jgi:hypothetical protein
MALVLCDAQKRPDHARRATDSLVSNRPTLIQISWAVLAVSVTLGWLTAIGWVVERVAGLML